MDYQVFSIGQRLFCVATQNIAGVTAYAPVLKTGMAPRTLTGLATLEGRVVPVINMDKRLMVTGREPLKDPMTLVLKPRMSEEVVFGICIDKSEDTIEVNTENAVACESGCPEWLVGTVTLKNRRYSLLDPSLLLLEEELDFVTLIY